MKTAIIGSRTFDNYQLLKETIAPLNPTEIVSGGAKGADSLGEQYAKENGIKTTIFLPDWKLHGKSAGFKRNVDIISNADVVVAFWDGVSKGTKHSIELAKKQGKTIIIVNF